MDKYQVRILVVRTQPNGACMVQGTDMDMKELLQSGDPGRTLLGVVAEHYNSLIPPKPSPGPEDLS